MASESDKSELIKYRELVLATLDYNLERPELHIKTETFDSFEYFRSLKKETIGHFEKGRLTKLKQWFRDLTEMHVESRNNAFNAYLKDKTGYDIDLNQNHIK